jgi:hypothetical protein
VTQISQDSESTLAVLDYECDAINTVMWCRDGVDGYMLKLNRFASFEMSDIRKSPQFAPAVNGLERGFGEVNRKTELALKDSDALGVIAMVVTD